MRGDLLLYQSDNSLRSRIVVWYTRGPFVHIEVDLGDGTSISARSEDGVTLHVIDLQRTVRVPLHTLTTPDRIEAGIAWLKEQVGTDFSWSAIFDHALPASLVTWIFGRQSLYDCANLVARYLEITGGLVVTHGKLPPMIVSPNDIARAAGLL